MLNDPLDLKARERTSFTSQGTIGSTFVARCAGREDANLAMRPNISDTAMNVFGSSGVMTSNIPWSNRASGRADEMIGPARKVGELRFADAGRSRAATTS